MTKRLALFLFALLLLSACAPACDVDGYRETIAPIVAQWDDALSIAQQTPRMSLPERISELQDIQRQAEALEVDECLQPAHAHLVEAMEYTVFGFLAFLGKEEDTVVQVFMDKADAATDNYADALAALEEQ